MEKKRHKELRLTLLSVGVFVIFLIVAVFGDSLTGSNILLAIGDEDGEVRYWVSGLKNFIQCFDSDPLNLGDVKGVCHSQYYVGDKDEIVGMNAIDYCKSKEMVVDYYCAKDFSCQPKISKCEKGHICKNGRFVKEKNELLKIFNPDEMGKSFGRMFGLN